MARQPVCNLAHAFGPLPQLAEVGVKIVSILSVSAQVNALRFHGLASARDLYKWISC